FDFIRANSAPGSVVVYDYVLKQVIQGDTKKLYAAAYLAYSVERVGEPYVFGWTLSEAKAWVQKRGFQLVEDVDHSELTRRHLTGSDGRPDGRMHDWLRLVEARVR